MQIFQIFCCVFFVIFYSFSPANAQIDMGGEKHVNIRLLAERGVVSGSDEIWIAIDQNIRSGWHVYWKNPGDSGTAMRLEWNMPEGFELSALEWPVPRKVSYGSLLSYGYENNVVLLQKLKMPKELPIGEIVLKASYEILVCNVECIPEFGEETLRLNSVGTLEEDNSAYIAKALKNIPSPHGASGRYYEQGDQFIVSIPVLENQFTDENVSDVFFIPEEWGIIDNMGTVSVKNNKTELILSQKRGARDLTLLDDLKIMVSFGDQNAAVVKAQKWKQKEQKTLSSYVESKKPLANSDYAPKFGIWNALILALLGGLILNLMPCVFPVLSIKVLGLVKMSEEQPWVARGHGLAYMAGVVLSFLIISGVLMILKSAGEEIGWGFQLQNPVIVSVLIYLLFVIGLNLAGFFEFSQRFSNIGSHLTQGKGFGGSFFTGMLATLVAAPCTAPFMGAAISFALAQNIGVGLLVFAILGFGLALPYVVFSFSPALRHILPKPGAWMEVFKQFLAFPIFASTVWLFWVLNHQVGSIGILSVGVGLILIVFGIWTLKVRPEKGIIRYTALILSIISFVSTLILIPSGERPVQAEAVMSSISQNKIIPDIYSTMALNEALTSNDPVFVEMTAAWCITCKVNYKTSLDIEQTQNIMAQRNVRYLVGDWTNQDTEITKYLHRYGRNGVPIYVYYGRPDKNGERPEAVVLPQILTPTIVAEYLDQ